MAEITMITLKTFKSSPSPLLRYHALLALAASLSTAKRAVMDATMKDVLKQMRNGLGDKSLAVQRGCCAVRTLDFLRLFGPRCSTFTGQGELN